MTLHGLTRILCGRLLLARQLLADKTRSIKEVGFAVGFENVPAFHRAFKRWTGESPPEFRSSMQQAEPTWVPETTPTGSGGTAREDS